MLKTLFKLDYLLHTILLATFSYFFVYGYFVEDMMLWGALFFMLLISREIIKKSLKVGDSTVTKPFDEMTTGEKWFSLTLKAVVYTLWTGYILLVFYEDGDYLHSPAVSIFYVLVVLCIVMDVAMYRIRKRNDVFLKS